MRGDDESEGLLPPHGGYRRLRSFQVATLVYDGTVVFCDRFIDRRSRTKDQMVQAARSGRQNIAEGSVASGTSKKTELRLTNVAKASLEELLLDFEDYLRQHGLPQWDKGSEQALEARQRGTVDGLVDASAEVAANTLICLINQATYLLRRQIQRLEADFVEHGGISERLYRRRAESRPRSDGAAPSCQRCGSPMRRRQARNGPHAGSWFWGCAQYPSCQATRPLADEAPEP